VARSGPPALGEFIRTQRELHELSMRQLAKMAGISNPSLSLSAAASGEWFRRKAVTPPPKVQVPAMDDEQARRAGVLLVDDCGCGTRADRVPADASLSSNVRAGRVTITLLHLPRGSSGLMPTGGRDGVAMPRSGDRADSRSLCGISTRCPAG
jgi:hypothetical protein